MHMFLKKGIIALPLILACASFSSSAELLIENAGDSTGLTNSSVTYTFEDLDYHRAVLINFDLFIYDSWDGLNHNDYFGFSVDGEEFIWSFRLSGKSTVYVNSPDAPIDDNYVTGPYNDISTWGDADRFYDDFYGGFIIPHLEDTLTITFFGRNLQGVNDESWAVNDLSISTDNYVDLSSSKFLLKDVNSPTTFSMMFLAFSLIATRRKLS